MSAVSKFCAQAHGLLLVSLAKAWVRNPLRRQLSRGPVGGTEFDALIDTVLGEVDLCGVGN